MSRRRAALLLAGACLLLALGIWVNTGTLAPLGATLANPFVWEPCHYLLNIDHFHYKAAFLMLDGAPRAEWEFSVALRRILYFLVAYPAMKVLGFGAGGLVTNVVISCAALVVFWLALQRRFEGRVPAAVLFLLATYPGWFYWTGTPYSYAAIVPASLLCMALLWKVETLGGWRAAALAGLGLGVLFTAYDLLPFFGGAALLLLAWRRRWIDAVVLAVAQLVPSLLVNETLERFYQVPFRNANTEAYWRILGAWLPPYDGKGWWALLKKLPLVTFDNFVYSNFVFVPLLFVVALVVTLHLPLHLPEERAAEERTVGRAELCLLLVAALLFLFNNAAPPYAGWQLRGSWIARLYQPTIPALVSIVATVLVRRERLPAWPRRAVLAALGLTLALDAWVVFAPVFGQPDLSGALYHRFYRHAPASAFADNLRKYGRRPIGFCSSVAPASSAASVAP